MHKRIKQELQDIDQTVELALDAWEGSQHFSEQQTHFLNSLALNLHSFYNGLERIFETIARRLDPIFPEGRHWHHHLLAQMGQEFPGIRPAVLSTESVEKLDEFLAFRHRLRNLYTFNLEAHLLQELLERVPSAWQCAKADIELFCNLLHQAASEKN